MTKHLVIFSGGEFEGADTSRIGRHDFVIAADSGLLAADHFGFAVDLAVGDFDSAPAELVAQFEASGTVIDRHPAAKDASDLELALDLALAREPERVTIVGGAGGRLDHLMGSLLLFTQDRYAELHLRVLCGPAIVTIVRGQVELQGSPGDYLTLLALPDEAAGIQTAGLRWPLNEESLYRGSTRGVSNEFLDPLATVSIRSGVLIAIQPGPE